MKMKKVLAGSLIVTSLAGGIVAPASVVNATDETTSVDSAAIETPASEATAVAPTTEALVGEVISVHVEIYQNEKLVLQGLKPMHVKPGEDPVAVARSYVFGDEFGFFLRGENDRGVVRLHYTTEVPTTEAPTTEAPTTEVPTTEAPATEVPTTEVPTTEAPVTESQKATISFDLAGGSLNGQIGTVTLEAKVGDVITLPEAPTREGYQFLHWKGSVYQPGASYTVTGPKTFTAVWEPVAAPAGTSTSTPAPTTSEAEKKILPVTGEAGSLLPFLGLALLSAGAYYKGRKK